jgi:hypothetical protein
MLRRALTRYLGTGARFDAQPTRERAMRVWLPIILGASLLTIAPVRAQSPARVKTPDEVVAGTWAWGHDLAYVRDHFVKAAEEFPEDKYNYRPAEESRTFAEIVMHVARVNHLNATDAMHAPELDVSAFAFHSKAQALDVLRQSFTQLEQALNVKPGAPQVIEAEIHASEHYGNLVVYYRLNGLVPPASR